MRAEVAIIGGGPAGSAAACALAKAGRSVEVLEKQPGPADKMCGDFLSGEALADLAALGIDLAALGAEPVTGVRLIHGDRMAEAALPFSAAGLSRRTLDEALLQRAAALGATVRRGVAVRSLGADGTVETSDGPVTAGGVFLATGKHPLRGIERPGSSDGLIGFKTYLRADPAQAEAMRGFIEMVLFRGGYAGLQRVEGGRITLCLLVARQHFAAVGSTWDGLFGALLDREPHLARRLAGAHTCLDRPLAISGVPYGFVHAPRAGDPARLFRLGDQAAVIPSLAGDGVAIALRSGRLAASGWISDDGADAYHRRLRRSVVRPVASAFLLHRLCRGGAQSWVVRACHHAPPLLRFGATLTRLREPI